MKNISQILNLLKSQKTFSKINVVETFNMFYKIIPKNISSGIEFMYIKNDTLFMVLKHQIYKTECEYNKATLKKILTQIPQIAASDIKFFVSNKKQIKSSTQAITDETYNEKSHGIFTNLAKDENLNDKFEEIRAIILKK